MYHPSSPQATSSHSIHPSNISTRLRLPVTTSLPNLRRDSKQQQQQQQQADHHSMLSPPGSPALSNTHSPAALQNHIYSAFLERRTADVALHVRGSWHAIYKLHRVVLIQAGFFQSLFTSGFAESKTKLSSHRLGPDVLDIVLEDPNITRAAFEVCIAHLYGGGPELYISPSLIPTTRYPLSLVFPADVGASDSFYLSGCPSGQHPASPRFLLSLLATAVFLSITPIATQAMASILNTIGPYTVIRYLNFALGKGIGEPDADEPEAAAGLEGVAELLHGEEDSILEVDESAAETPRALSTVDPLEKRKESLSEPNSEGEGSRSSYFAVRKEDPSEGDSSHHSSHSPTRSDFEQSFFYGVISDKIGEAAACWLARWGVDMLQYELRSPGREVTEYAGPASTVGNRRRASTVPGGGSSSSPTPLAKFSGGGRPNPDFCNMKVPEIWRRRGLTARWVRGLLSSDMLFVAGEKERYDWACRVVELRRAEGSSQDEESEYDALFAKGIYYANMGLDELISISKDISPSTGKLYVPLSVLQSAHWDQSVLRHAITARPSGSTSSPSSPVGSSPSPGTKELGITMFASELGATFTSPTKESEQRIPPDAPYFPVPSDSSQRIGDSTGIEGASLQQLFEGQSACKAPDGTTMGIPCSEAHFFGIEQQCRSASTIPSQSTSDKARWSPYPPFRFSVEFWDVEALKEKSRLHSRTIWYAGSLWNVYVQVVRKKGIQLGVYLHRQSTIDPIPPSSAPVMFPPETSASAPSTLRGESSRFTGVPLHQTVSTPTVQYPTPNTSRSATPHSTPSTPAMSSSLPSSYSQVLASPTSHSTVSIPATSPPVAPAQPYRDPRSAVSAYFTVACAGPTGSSITRFSSAPDVFSVSQSWGWKSSSLRAGDSDLEGDGISRDTVAAGREVSLRATVMLGVV